MRVEEDQNPSYVTEESGNPWIINAESGQYPVDEKCVLVSTKGIIFGSQSLFKTTPTILRAI